MAEGLLKTAGAVAVAALATEGVHSLGHGHFVEAATYERGDKVSGVVVTDEEVEVHVVAGYPFVKPLPDLSRDITERVIPVSGGRRTSVVFEDIAVENAKDTEVGER